MKFFSPVPLLMCALVVTAAGISGASKANAEQPGIATSSMTAQDSAQDGSTTVTVSGNWQMSWTARNGNQRQATLQVQQDGSKLSGTLQSERGSIPMTGSVHGNQVSLTLRGPRRKISFKGTVDGDKMSGTTKRGRSWMATRQ